MSRLIDSDALIEAIRSHYENVYCEDAVLNNFYRLAHEHVIDVVNVQPTAYDVEKVVAGLEHEAKLQGYFREDACKRLNVAQGNIHRYAEQCYQNAIDIVKRGGIE